MSSKIQSLNLPKTVPVTTTRFRPPKKYLPQTKPERDAVLQAARGYVENHNPVPPMPQDELEVHARKLIAEAQIDERYLDYAGVVLNNEMWREALGLVLEIFNRA